MMPAMNGYIMISLAVMLNNCSVEYDVIRRIGMSSNLLNIFKSQHDSTAQVQKNCS